MILKYTINQRINAVYLYLSDLKKFAEVHPLIYKSEEMGNNDYILFEKITFLFIPFQFSYKVSILNKNENETVLLYSEIKKGIALFLTFSLQEQEGKTYVEEKIDLKAPTFVKIIFYPLIKSAHRKMFNNMEKQL